MESREGKFHFVWRPADRGRGWDTVGTESPKGRPHFVLRAEGRGEGMDFARVGPTSSLSRPTGARVGVPFVGGTGGMEGREGRPRFILGPVGGGGGSVRGLYFLLNGGRRFWRARARAATAAAAPAVHVGVRWKHRQRSVRNVSAVSLVCRDPCECCQ